MFETRRNIILTNTIGIIIVFAFKVAVKFNLFERARATIKIKIINEISVSGKYITFRLSQKLLSKLQVTVKKLIKIKPTIFFKILPPKYSEISIISNPGNLLSNLKIK